jgi:hypothetical protein
MDLFTLDVKVIRLYTIQKDKESVFRDIYFGFCDEPLQLFMAYNK